MSSFKTQEKLILVMALSLLLTACFKKPTPSPSAYKLVDMLPKTTDQNLDLNKSGPKAELAPGDMDTGELFQLIQDLDELGRTESRPTLIDGSKTLHKRFYSDKNTHSKSSFAEAPYTQLLISRAEPDFIKATKDLDKFFLEQKTIISQVARQIEVENIAPKNIETLSSAIEEISKIVQAFELQISTSPLDSDVKAEIRLALYEEFWAKLPASQTLANRLNKTTDFTEAIYALKDILSTLNINLDQSAKERLDAAIAIDQSLDKELSPKSAFRLIINLWDQMNDQERKETFGSFSPELYKYLNSKKRSQIECMAKNECSGFVTRFIKRFIILPEIKKYGVKKLQDEINLKASAQLNTQAADLARDLLKDIPSLLEAQIHEGLNKEERRFTNIRQNFSGYVARQAQRWFEAEFNNASIPALENRRISFTKANNVYTLNGITRNGQIETSPDALAQALSSAATRLSGVRSQDKSYERLELLMRINQILAHGGFSKANSEPFPSLSRVWESRRSNYLNIENLPTKQLLIGMPSPAPIISGFQIVENQTRAQIRVMEQARLLNAFTNIMLLFRDWEKSPSDDLLDHYLVKDILNDLPSDALKQTAFPKDAFLAIALGNLTTVLYNLKADYSPVFLQCIDGKIAWQSKEACKDFTALAAMTDINNGTRSATVKTIDLSAFLISSIRFLQIAEDLKRTKSVYLTTSASPNTPPPLKELEASLPKIKSLAIGMTNYLTHVLQDKSGRFYSEVIAGAKPQTNSRSELKVQLSGLEAITVAAKYFNAQPYRSSAISAYHFLNQAFWSDKDQFYSTKKRVSAHELARTLNILKNFRPLVNTEPSSSQIDLLLRKYSYALELEVSEYLATH